MISKPHPNISTAEQLSALPSNGSRYELIKGKLRMMSPAGSEHGRVAMAIGASLFSHVKQYRLGKVYAAETGFKISMDPDTVRAPDAAFVSQGRLDACANDVSSYLALAPDLVVEVVSPSDVFSDVEAKAAQWLNAGSAVVVVANPQDQTLRVYRVSNRIEILRQGEEFQAGDACGNWTIAVDTVFD